MRVTVKNNKLSKDVPDGDYDLIKCNKKRSNGQNAHLHYIVLPMVSKAMSNLTGKKVTNALAKEVLKYKFLQTFTEAGTVVTPTSKLSTVQWMEFLTKVQQYGAEILKISIPSPNEESYGIINK